LGQLALDEVVVEAVVEVEEEAVDQIESEVEHPIMTIKQAKVASE
jgi:hypothetical protein